MQEGRKFGPPSPYNGAMAGLRPATTSLLDIEAHPPHIPAARSESATPYGTSRITNRHASIIGRDSRITDRCPPIAGTPPIDVVLGGRSGTCPECSRGSSDITDLREARSSCTGSSAQAFKDGVGKGSRISEMSCDGHPTITAFLIDTPAIRIALNSTDYIVGAHSNRHSSGAWEHISARRISFASNNASQRFESFTRRSSSVPYGLYYLAATRGQS